MVVILRWVFLATYCLPLLAAVSPSFGQIKITPNQEYKEKANFIFNFARFTTWPSDMLAKSDRFKLCVLGKDPFGLFLDLVAIRGVKGHEVDLLRLTSNDQAHACHLLFLAADAVSKKGQVPVDLLRRGLFVVADTPGLARHGATANLVKGDDGKVHFEINVNAARRAALILSTQLLRLGRLTTDIGDKQL